MTESKPLPGMLATIETAAGRQAALSFAHQWGGLRVTVPYNESTAPWFLSLPSIAQVALRRDWGGIRINVPTLGARARKPDVWQKASKLYQEGRSIAYIARSLRIPRRSVCRLLKRRAS